jgi:hypothetical protein
MDRIIDSLINYQRLLVLIGGLLLVFTYGSRDIDELDQVRQDIAALSINIYSPIAKDVQDRADARYRRQWAEAFRQAPTHRSEADRAIVLRAIARATLLIPYFMTEKPNQLIRRPGTAASAQPPWQPASVGVTGILPMPPAMLIGYDLEKLLPEALKNATIAVDLIDLKPESTDILADVLLANDAALGKSGLLRIMLAATSPTGDACTLVVDDSDPAKGETRAMACTQRRTNWAYRPNILNRAPQPGIAGRISDFFAANGTLRDKPLREIQAAIDDKKSKARAEVVDLGGVKFPGELVIWPFVIVIVTIYMLMLAELRGARRLLTSKPVEVPGAKAIGWFAMFEGVAVVPMLTMFVLLPCGAAGYALLQLGYLQMIVSVVVLVFAIWFACEVIRVSAIVRTKAAEIGETLKAV